MKIAPDSAKDGYKPVLKDASDVDIDGESVCIWFALVRFILIFNVSGESRSILQT